MSLPNDVARCVGVGHLEGRVMEWSDGCEDCLRRTDKLPLRVPIKLVNPPTVIVFERAFRIAQEDRK